MQEDPDLPVFSAAALRALREDEPSRLELDAAYRRFGRGSTRRSPGLLVSRWLVAGLAMGLGVAFAAEAVVQQLRPDARPTQPSLTPLHAAPQAMTPARPAGPRPSEPPQLPTEPEALVPPAKTAPPANSALSKASAAERSPEPGPADSALWARAARGLRNNDFGETESALSVLEQAGRASDREAARLIRAQLMIHQGDFDGARVLLEDLAAHAQSPLVRNKARTLFDQTSAKTISPLSASPSGT